MAVGEPLLGKNGSARREWYHGHTENRCKTVLALFFNEWVSIQEEPTPTPPPSLSPSYRWRTCDTSGVMYKFHCEGHREATLLWILRQLSWSDIPWYNYPQSHLKIEVYIYDDRKLSLRQFWIKVLVRNDNADAALIKGISLLSFPQ